MCVFGKELRWSSMTVGDIGIFISLFESLELSKGEL